MLYSQHARQEMHNEPLGHILEEEVFEAVMAGEMIEDYPDDQPYHSCLVLGRTGRQRAIHVVCAHGIEEDLAIIITVYEPDPAKWIEYRRRILS